MMFAPLALLAFIIGLPGEALFWTVDTVHMIQGDEVCRPKDQTVSDYFMKGHWTEAPWRPVCKEEE